MRIRLKHVLVTLVLLLLVSFAYGPLVGAGPLGGDLRVLVEGGVAPGSAAKPLTRLSIELSRLLWGLPTLDDAFAVALGLRAENLLLHGLCALALGFFIRRLLLPWTGSDASRAAARATAIVYLVHPLIVPAVADVGARGELLALALGASAAAAFLRGRQDRRTTMVVSAGLLAMLAGLASDVALGLPFLLVAAEFASSHRYRKRRVRVRTALATLVVFGAAVLIDPLVRLSRSGAEGLPESLRALAAAGSLEGALQVCNELVRELGLLVVPASPQVLGIAGVALAGVSLLLAVQPALVAARSAPRLWGWLLVGWFAALLGSELLHVHAALGPASLGDVRFLLPSIAVTASGLGLAATALSGSGRPWLAWAVAVAYAILAHAYARPYREAGREVDELRHDVLAARDVHGERQLLVIDPPVPFRGVDPLGGALRYLAHPALARGERSEVDALPEVTGLTAPAFLALVSEPEFRALLVDELVVLFPRTALGTAEAAGGTPRRPYRLLGPATPSSGARAWDQTLSSPALDLDPLLDEALVVTAPADVELDGLRRVTWRARGSEPVERGSVVGAWRPAGDDLVGVFDFSSSLAWRLGGRVQALLFEEGTQSLTMAEVRSELPALHGGDDGSGSTASTASTASIGPRTRGDDWLFALPRMDGRLPAEGVLELGVLDLVSYRWRTFPVRVESSGLIATGVARFAGELPEGTPLAWTLDLRVDGRAVARSRGRR